MAERPIEEIAEEVLRLDQEATLGPWWIDESEGAVSSGEPGTLSVELIAQAERDQDSELIATFRTAAPELAREVLRRIHLRTMNDRCAAALADEVAVLVRRGVIDARSPAADALLDLRSPPTTPRSERLATLEAQLGDARDEARRAQNQWIPVQERLPDAFEWVLITFRDGLILRGCKTGDGWEIGQPRVEPLQDVTHWMPMPAAPEVVRG